MKSDGFMVILKLVAHVIIGVFGPWSAALAQWVNSGEMPGKIIWIAVILPASAIGGASAVLAFLSGSYTQYKAERKSAPTSHPNQ